MIVLDSSVPLDCQKYTPPPLFAVELLLIVLSVMVGDAPGDLEAAQTVGCLFFPIIPGQEPASWVELRTVALDHLHAGTFIGGYQGELIARFNTALSPIPPFA